MKIIFFDLESTDLSASWGRVLCASFATLSGEVYTLRADKKPYKSKDLIDDSKLVVACKAELEDADMICSWNGKMFDIPLLNARLALAGEEPVKPKRHLDLMYYAGYSSMRVGSKRLDNIAKFFKLDNQKTPLDGPTWQRAATGDKKAMNLIAEHCEADVLVLRELWPHLAPLVKQFTLPLSAWWRYADEIEAPR